MAAKAKVIMSNSFVKVATVSEVAQGQTRRVESQNHPILLANVAGTIYACDDTCTHEDSSLSLGCLEGELIKCTLHNSRFNVRTGEPVEEPAEEPLQTYPVRVEGQDILIQL